MKDANDNKMIDWVDTSNAVLTPHLIHPNFFKRSMTRVHQGATQDFGPISDGTPWREDNGQWFYWWGFKWLPYVGPKTKSFYAKFRSV